MAKKTGQETIQVVLTKHAAWDSIPLRFGVDPKNRWGEIKGTKKKREKNKT